MSPDTHKLTRISQDVKIIRGEIDTMTFEKFVFDVFPALIKNLNLFVLKSHHTTQAQAYKRDSDPTHTTDTSSYPSLLFSSPF